ncbi:hypothetical protein OK016_27525 [Vibrio chagasii]|nr:hypothetical protein [Vibrio chagasii]
MTITPIGGEASLEVGALKLVKPENEQMTMHAVVTLFPRSSQVLVEDFSVPGGPGYLE